MSIVSVTLLTIAHFCALSSVSLSSPGRLSRLLFLPIWHGLCIDWLNQTRLLIGPSKGVFLLVRCVFSPNSIVVFFVFPRFSAEESKSARRVDMQTTRTGNNSIMALFSTNGTFYRVKWRKKRRYFCVFVVGFPREVSASLSPLSLETDKKQKREHKSHVERNHKKGQLTFVAQTIIIMHSITVAH